MNDWQNEDQDEVIAELLSRLDFFKPTLPEMLSEIAQSGVAIKFENADSRFFESNRDEVITYMWKVVRVAKILKEKKMDIKFNFEEPKSVKGKIVN